MSMSDHSQGTILSPTPCVLSFPTHHSMLDILDGLTPRAFTFPSAVHDTISNNGSSSHCSPLLSRVRPHLVHCLLPSSQNVPEIHLAINDSSESARPTLRISICMHHSHSLHAATTQPHPSQSARPYNSHAYAILLAGTEQRSRPERTRTDTISSAVRISSSTLRISICMQPLTLAARRTTQPHPSQSARPYNSHAYAILLAGTEQRSRPGDEDYIKQPKNALILY
ncbi:uncharacterized protein FOMMEDRAFT_161124 [Fomitiporia mediterranea MF3/22]|uniref:uncharacterized protein n=1 Tax=Fomitiporia mediterranea (strain MF3/22) TaxID=694068 RepID=UPI0004409A29|nr:uncharacterized protein FOMMEDRAFT_161124 [Fomitiporia mediterranea MF3/22]EJC98930.1 hypothetical protein FOMMEDRAFT_161124 [Fomitiporia mediterranea MF3/22]